MRLLGAVLAGGRSSRFGSDKAAALRHGADRGLDAVLTTACHIPVLPMEAIPTLLATMTAFLRDATIIGCWPVGPGSTLESFLADPDRFVKAWARACGAREVATAGPIANINYHEDLEAPASLRPGL